MGSFLSTKGWYFWPVHLAVYVYIYMRVYPKVSELAAWSEKYE
jgi:hypothetical protein